MLRYGDYVFRFYLIFFIILIQTLTSCESNNNPSAKDKNSKNTGSIIVHTHWETKGTQSHTRQLDCNSTHVQTIEINVYDQQNKMVTSAGPFDCNDHKGSVSRVPEGVFNVVLIARNSNHHILFIGEDGQVSVNAGKSNQADIHAAYFVPKAISPPDQTNLNRPKLSWKKVDGAHQYSLKISKSINMAPIAPVIIKGDVMEYYPEDIKEDTTYYWQVASMDKYGNTSEGSSIRTFSKQEHLS